MKHTNRISLFLLSLALMGTSAVSISGKSVLGEYYPSPSVDDGTAPTIEKIVDPETGDEYEAVIKNKDDKDYKWVINVDLVSYPDAKSDPAYTEAEEGEKKAKVLVTLIEVYGEYTRQPVRAFNPEEMTSDLARQLSGNPDFDASNLCATYLFDLSFGETCEAECQEWLYEDPNNYLEVKFKMTTTMKIAPVILYKCDPSEQDPNNQKEPTWEVNNSGVIDAENGVITYKFYSLCPMLFVEAAEHTMETENHPEWSDPSSPDYVPMVDKKLPWIVPEILATETFLILLSLTIIPGRKRHKENATAAFEEETANE